MTQANATRLNPARAFTPRRVVHQLGADNASLTTGGAAARRTAERACALAPQSLEDAAGGPLDAPSASGAGSWLGLTHGHGAPSLHRREGARPQEPKRRTPGGQRG